MLAKRYDNDKYSFNNNDNDNIITSRSTKVQRVGWVYGKKSTTISDV